MLTADIGKKIKNLTDFYESIRAQQESAHGAHYCAHHDLIREFAPGCKSYKELGTHQGASAAAAILSGFNEFHLVDLTMEKFQPHRRLFEKRCAMLGVKLNIYEMSSIDPRCVGSVDMLMIDSLHQWRWTEQELAAHAQFVDKYIVFHDTSVVNGRRSDIWPGLVRWCRASSGQWEVLRRVTENVGATIIHRVG